jgi:hypothetical protein
VRGAEVEAARMNVQFARGGADRAIQNVLSEDLQRMSHDLDLAATTVRSLRMILLGADVPPPPAILEVARRHAVVLAVLDDDHLPSVAPAQRREERLEARRRWTDYRALLLDDPDATLSLGV